MKNNCNQVGETGDKLLLTFASIVMPKGNGETPENVNPVESRGGADRSEGVEVHDKTSGCFK